MVYQRNKQAFRADLQFLIDCTASYKVFDRAVTDLQVIRGGFIDRKMIFRYAVNRLS